MSFDLAQYDATIERLRTGLHDLSRQLDRVPAVVANASDQWYVTAPMASTIRAAGDTILRLGNQILDRVIDLLRGATAPVRFFVLANDWAEVRGVATTVAGTLSPAALSVDYYWQGMAADAYVAAIKPQVDAANRIGVMADKTSSALAWSATAGLAFYLTLLVIIIKLVIAMVTALTALGTVVFSWAGAALIIEEAGVDGAVIITAMAALMTLLGTQATQLTALHSEGADNTAFPNRHWPLANSGRYTDATVTDGDADWSIAR